MADDQNLFNATTETPAKRWGAEHGEWLTARKALGYAHLLPSVHTPAAVLPRNPESEAAKITGGDLSKIPSHVRNGLAEGLGDWRNRNISQAIVRTWSQNPHYGICLRLGKPWHAIDLDLDDAEAVAEALAIIARVLPGLNLPMRLRANSPRKTLLVSIENPQKKTKIITVAEDKAAGRKAQQVEFLGDGQQTVIAGTHSSGARIEWAGGVLTTPPVITVEQWQALIAAIREHFDPTGELNLQNKPAPIRTTFAEYAPSNETSRYGSGILRSACKAIADAPDGGRNDVLNTQAMKVYQAVAGGEIDEADAELALYSAADAAGLDPAEIDATMASAKRKGLTEPRKAPPRIASPDEFPNLPPIPESPQVRANKAAAAPVAPVSPESVGQPGGGRPAQYVDPGFIALPDTGAKGRILNTSRNLRAVVKAHGVHLAYNVVSKRIDINVPGLKAHPDEHQNAALTIIEDFAVRAGMTGAKIPQQVLALAVRRPYNPFLSWIHSAPWDGVDRLDALAGTVQCTDHAMQEIFKILLRRWLLSVVASQTKTGFWSKGCLVLQGKQSKGKTSWFRRLFADVPEVFADGVTLAIGDKDSLMNVLSHVAVELGELDGTFRKSDLAGLKAFISRKADRLRRPYAAGTSEWSRRTVFCATVNDAQFLSDDTGNSRFWAVSITALDYQHNINMQQVWAQVAALLDTGEQWHLTDEEAERLNESNKEFEIVDPIEELIRVRFDPTRPGRNYSRTASQVVREIVGIANPTMAQCKKAGVVLAAMGFKSRKSHGAKVFDLPQPWESYEAPEIE